MLDEVMFNGDDKKSEPGNVMLADNKIDCYGNEFDDELEEGEIVDDDDDNEVIQVVERKTEPEHDEQNPSCIYNECSGEKKRRDVLSYGQTNMRFSRYANISHTEESSYNDSIKRKSYYLTDDDDRSGDEIVGYKRRRSEKTNKNHTVLRNEPTYQHVKRDLGDLLDDDHRSEDGMARHKKRRLNTTQEKMHSVSRNVSRHQHYENEKGDFQSSRHSQHSWKRNDEQCKLRSNDRRAMPSYTCRSDVEPTRKIRKMKLCRYYRANRHCYRKDQCMYMHGEFPCKYYHTGIHCYSGDKCRYNHAEIDECQKKLLLKNTIEEHSRPLVRNNVLNNKIPSLLDMRISFTTGLKESYNSNATTPSTSRPEPIVDNISVSTEGVAKTVYPQALPDYYDEPSDDDDEKDNLVIDEGD